MHISNTAQKIIFLVILTLFFLFVPLLNAQELRKEQLDSLYIKFLQISARELLPIADQLQKISFENKKCGFEIVSRIRLNISRFSESQQNVLKPLVFRPSLDTSVVSPSGVFRIHFDNSGTHKPQYDLSLSVIENVNLLAAAFDSTYYYEVDFLKYVAPPQDNGQGGDNLYDVYIYRTGYYGITTPEDVINPNYETYTSYIQIDPGFQSGFFTEGINAARVTAAHEVHHAIQIGNYTFRFDDAFFHEITSTSMEEFVFDDVNDYYAYIKDYTNNPSRKFSRNNVSVGDGYDLAIWNLYLKERYGFDIIKQQWELMPGQRAIVTINTTIGAKGSTFARELNKFGIWTYFTNYRAIPGLFFEEAANYPLIEPMATIQFSPPSETVQVDAEPTSNNFVRFNIPTNGDTLFAVITNGDVFSAVEVSNPLFGFEYVLFSDSVSGERKLTSTYSSDFSTSNPNWWSVSEILNGIVVREDSAVNYIPQVAESFSFPNPFNYKGNLFISIDAKAGESVDFNVYSSGLTLVHSSQEVVTLIPNNTIGIKWDGRDENGKKFASGVYIYVIKRGDEVVKGKVVIFNE